MSASATPSRNWTAAARPTHAHFPTLGIAGDTNVTPINVIADNCGTSVRMIEKTYAKILAEKRRDFIERGAPTFSESRL
jgi:hypothetical protein